MTAEELRERGCRTRRARSACSPTGRRRTCSTGADAEGRREHRRRLRQHRRARGEGARRRRHQHAGRADRGDGGAHVGADPRRRAPHHRRATGWSGAAAGRAGRSTSCSARSCAASSSGSSGAAGSAGPWPPGRRRSACTAVFGRSRTDRGCRSTSCWSARTSSRIHTPLTPQDRHLIDRRALARMKRTAILVNTARGPIVDEEALAWALKERLIAAAALDVYEREPSRPRGAARPRERRAGAASRQRDPRNADGDDRSRHQQRARRCCDGRPPLTPVRPTVAAKSNEQETRR